MSRMSGNSDNEAAYLLLCLINSSEKSFIACEVVYFMDGDIRMNVTTDMG